MLHINTKQMLDSLDKSIESKEHKFNLSDFYDIHSFIPHTLALFAKVQLHRSDDGLISAGKSILAVDDQTTIDLIKFTASANRSKMYPSTIKEHTFKAFTPLFMYAHKLYNGIGYGEWDREDKYIHYVLGRALSNMKEFADNNEKPVYTLEEVKQLRNDLMVYKSGAKAGQVESPLGYKMLKCGGIPADIMRMELQTWIANAELRDEKAMILDMWDWINIPEPYDVVIESTPIVAQATTRVTDKWDLL